MDMVGQKLDETQGGDGVGGMCGRCCLQLKEESR